MNKEEWKDIDGYDGVYQVSNCGRTRSFKWNKYRILKKTCDTKGYIINGFYLSGKRKIFRVHRLVGMSFIPNPKNYETINHLNLNKADNRVENLEWCSHMQNVQHAIMSGVHPVCIPRGSKNAMSKLDKKTILIIRSLYKNKKYTQKEIAKKFKVHPETIYRIVNKKTWKHV